MVCSLPRYRQGWQRTGRPWCERPVTGGPALACRRAKWPVPVLQRPIQALSARTKIRWLPKRGRGGFAVGV